MFINIQLGILRIIQMKIRIRIPLNFLKKQSYMKFRLQKYACQNFSNFKEGNGCRIFYMIFIIASFQSALVLKRKLVAKSLFMIRYLKLMFVKCPTVPPSPPPSFSNGPHILWSTLNVTIIIGTVCDSLLYQVSQLLRQKYVHLNYFVFFFSKKQ